MLTSIIYSPDLLPAKAGADGDTIATNSLSVARKVLCKPVSYETVQNIVCTKHFLSDQAMISMRLLCLSTDLPVIYHWLPWEFTRHMKKEVHVEHLKEMYRQLAESGSSQSFMVLMNNINIAQVDIFQAMADDVSLQYEAKPGDYKLQFLIKPERLLTGNYTSCIIEAVLQFFFSFLEVKRIVLQLDEHEYLNQKAGKAGFSFHKKFVVRQKTSMLYTCTKDSFLRTLV
jgi:hypothetical protein